MRMGTHRGNLPRLLPALLLLCALPLACAPAEDAEALFLDLDNQDFESRLEAREELADLVRQGRYDVFVRSLDSENLQIRALSIIYMSQMPHPKARAATRTLLSVDRRMMLPYNPVAMKPSRTTADSRVLVAVLISRSGGDPEAIDLLLAGVDPDDDPEVVKGTCLAIGALRDSQGLPFLVEVSGLRDDDLVRSAVQAMGHIRHPEAIIALEASVDHPAMPVRADVLSALSMWPGGETRQLIRRIGSGDAFPELRVNAIEVLAQQRELSLVPYFIERLGDPDIRVQTAAARALNRATGQTIGDDAAGWKSWWAANEAALSAAR